MRDWGENYQRIDPKSPGPGNVLAWQSRSLIDSQWDDFLRATPCGQFQQSSLWADYKAGEGWQHYRVIITENDTVVGGFQVLWRATRLGRIGYVSKGPVANPETVEQVGFLEALLRQTANVLGLGALIVQGPDESRVQAGESPDSGFIVSNPLGVIEATYLVDVRATKDELFARMSASLRRNIRRGRKRPIVLREGTRKDLPVFFELMKATCRRQSTKPNPGCLDSVLRLWDLFSSRDSIRLTLADCQGATPAAKLSLCFGDRLTVWKKGWDGSHDECHPNELLECEALEWAHDRGCRVCDFCSFNRSAASQLLQGRAEADLGLSSRDEYHLRFGGRPIQLPAARIHLPNHLFRWVYRNGYLRYERLKNRKQGSAT